MAYKDKGKQKEADRERQRRYRAERGRQAYPKGVTQGVTDSGCDKAKGVTQGVTTFTDLPNTETIPPVEKVRYKLPSVKVSSKRGKDIKVFEDLSVDVQQTIVTMAMVDGHIDETVKANRTAIAVHYQHQFPDRYHSTGVV